MTPGKAVGCSLRTTSTWPQSRPALAWRGNTSPRAASGWSEREVSNSVRYSCLFLSPLQENRCFTEVQPRQSWVEFLLHAIADGAHEVQLPAALREELRLDLLVVSEHGAAIHAEGPSRHYQVSPLQSSALARRLFRKGRVFREPGRDVSIGHQAAELLVEAKIVCDQHCQRRFPRFFLVHFRHQAREPRLGLFAADEDEPRGRRIGAGRPHLEQVVQVLNYRLLYGSVLPVREASSFPEELVERLVIEPAGSLGSLFNGPFNCLFSGCHGICSSCSTVWKEYRRKSS